MRRGQVLHGYLIVGEPTSDGTGRSVCAHAERAGHEYLVKEFLEPRCPRPESVGSPEARLLLRERCREFERRYWSVIGRIDPADAGAANLLTPVDFFHDGTRYYTVTHLLHPAEITPPHEMSPRQKAVLLASLASGLSLLHRRRIVHGNLTPRNVLWYRPAGTDLCTAKLTDLDGAFVAGHPPARDAIGRDSRYIAPELLLYLEGDPRVPAGQLTAAADLFAFGLIVHGYLTGELPGHDARFGSPAEAVDDGEALRLDGRLHPWVRQAVAALLSADPGARPAIAEVAAVLAKESVLALNPARILDIAPPPPIPVGAAPGPRPVAVVPAEPPPAPPRRSRARTSLTGRRIGGGSPGGERG